MWGLTSFSGFCLRAILFFEMHTLDFSGFRGARDGVDDLGDPVAIS